MYAAESAAVKALPQELLRQCAYEYSEKDIQALCSIIRTWVKATYGNACSGAEFACEMQVRFDSNGGNHLETPEGKAETWAQSVMALL